MTLTKFHIINAFSQQNGFILKKSSETVDIPDLEDNLTRASYNDFTEYLAAENQFLATIQNSVIINETTSFNRYARNNKSSPYVDSENLNASFEFVPDEEEIRGGVLLVHGLTDSPYHLKAIGEIFSENGFYVIGLRLPGHGPVPGGLLNVTWEDWYSAVKFGARMVLGKIENRKDSKFMWVVFQLEELLR